MTRDGTAETVSRDHILSGANGDREIFVFPVQLTTNRIGDLTWLILTLPICDDHTTNPRATPKISKEDSGKCFRGSII